MSKELNRKALCPDCGRTFSSSLVKFSVFLNKLSETEVEIYNICPLCALEQRNKRNGFAPETPFPREYSRNLYDQAVKENRGREKKSPISGKKIILEKLTKLTEEERQKVVSRHPELLDDKN